VAKGSWGKNVYVKKTKPKIGRAKKRRGRHSKSFSKRKPNRSKYRGQG
jgi:hypothetical protein